MARVKFALPTGPKLFTLPLQVRVSDLNYGGHLGNDRVLTLCHEARVVWLAQHQYSELNVAGQGLIMSDAMIMYQAEGHLGDELLLDIYMGETSSRGFDLYTQITRPSDQTAVARVKQGMLFFDYEKRKITQASSEVLERLSKSCL